MEHHQLISVKDFYDLTSDIPETYIDEMMDHWGQDGSWRDNGL